MTTLETQLIPIHVEEKPLLIEYAWIGNKEKKAPLLVFLHEGLGSVAMWKNFPQQLCAACGYRGLVYSRPGYGRSSPRKKEEHWNVHYLHDQAENVLPAVLKALNTDAPYSLLGHSDGGSIALIHAARFASDIHKLIVVAPHIFVEERCLEGIRLARNRYLTGNFRQRLARYHEDVDSAFWGWNNAWLAPEFLSWRITDLLPAIKCPILAVQGEEDAYATMSQIDGIAALAPDVTLLKLPDCGHVVHQDQTDRLLKACTRFLTGSDALKQQ